MGRLGWVASELSGDSDSSFPENAGSTVDIAVVLQLMDESYSHEKCGLD